MGKEEREAICSERVHTVRVARRYWSTTASSIPVAVYGYRDVATAVQLQVPVHKKIVLFREFSAKSAMLIQ